jgi:hypothetical protein
VAAQAYVINYVNDSYLATHQGSPLLTVPSEYAGTRSSTYRTNFASMRRLVGTEAHAGMAAAWRRW